MNRICDQTSEEVMQLMRADGTKSYRVYRTWQKLVQLLGDELKAAHALREENRHVTTHQDLPTGEKFGTWTRNYLIVNGLPWNQENLETASFHYMSIHGQ